MNELETQILSGQLTAKDFLEQIGFFSQEDKYKKVEQLIQIMITLVKTQIDITNESSKGDYHMLKSVLLNKNNIYLKETANPSETISSHKKTLKYLEDWQKEICLDRLKAIKKNDLEKDIFETKIEKLLALTENVIKIEDARKNTSSFGRKKIKINENKNYTKKEAAEILGLSIRRVEQIMQEVGFKYEKDKRGREKVISGKNLKEIIKKRA